MRFGLESHAINERLDPRKVIPPAPKENGELRTLIFIYLYFSHSYIGRNHSGHFPFEF